MIRQTFLNQMVVVVIGLFVSSCGPGQFLGPTITPSPTFTPTLTLTPTLTPPPTPTLTPTSTPTSTPSPQASFIILDVAINSGALGIVIQDEDTHGNKLDVFNVGLDCLQQAFYIEDETGTRLECAHVTNETDKPNRIGMIFIGDALSLEHQYQLIIPGIPPIELQPRTAS